MDVNRDHFQKQYSCSIFALSFIFQVRILRLLFSFQNGSTVFCVQ